MANQTITAPLGFQVAGVRSGIKQSGKLDLGMIYCPTGARAAAVFTTNKIVSAAVEVCRSHVKHARIDALVVNSGNANACTGQQGLNNAIDMCRDTAQHLGTKPGNVLVASTGIIGEQLPVPKLRFGIAAAAGRSIVFERVRGRVNERVCAPLEF